MNAKEYLKQIINIDKLINSKVKQVSDLKELGGIKSRGFDGMPSGGSSNPDKIAELVVKIVDLENDINDSIDKLIDLKKDAMNKIDQLSDSRYRLILNKRYLENETFEKIAVDMDLSWKWTHKLHKEALEELDLKFF